MSTTTVRSIRSVRIAHRVARQFVTVVALALLAEFGRPCARDATDGLAIRLSVEVPEHSPRDLCVWEELPLKVTVENVGEAGGVPATHELLAGPDGGAKLVARVRNLAAQTASEEEFLLDAEAHSVCYSTVQLLQQGEIARLEGSLCVRLDQISTGPGTVRDVLVTAFPTPGRYSVRVVYTWAGQSTASAPIEIDVLPAPSSATGALAALRDMQRAGLWIYRPVLMYADPEPERLASIDHLATAFGSNAYSDLACHALALHHAGLALLDPSVDANTRNARLREALAYLERICSPRFSRRDASEKLRARILELLGR